jgi:hypothetical protein
MSAVNYLVGFYDAHGGKGEVLFFCSVIAQHHTDKLNCK